MLDVLPHGWQPGAVVLDAMFLLNCSPLRHTTNITDYAKLLFKRFVLPQYSAGAREVHLVFDIKGQNKFNPKCFEQARRDQHSSNSDGHYHVQFTPITKIPTGWRGYIECRQCKQSIIEAIGLSYLQTARYLIPPHKEFVLAGYAQDGGTPMAIRENTLPEPHTQYYSNALEADMRIWTHVIHTEQQQVLVYSPDTDVYNIGLTITTDKECIVQVNLPHTAETKYVHLHNLTLALLSDPDLGSIPRNELNPVLQMLYICSGCDYISYFVGYGKAAFFNVFYQHATFISGNAEQGLLCDYSSGKQHNGFLAFLRLIGTLYFKKYYSVFVSVKGFETPRQMFNSLPTNLPLPKQHQQWYQQIRCVVSERITTEEERMPSHTALWRHWLRSCWIAQMWQNSPKSDIFQNLPPPENCGWKKNSSDQYVIDWECPEIQSQVQHTINFLLKGCTCKRGCQTSRCGCRKQGNRCGPGCRCQNCSNSLPTTQRTPEEESEDNSESSTSEDEEEIQTEIITDSTDLFDMSVS